MLYRTICRTCTGRRLICWGRQSRFPGSGLPERWPLWLPPPVPKPTGSPRIAAACSWELGTQVWPPVPISVIIVRIKDITKNKNKTWNKTSISIKKECIGKNTKLSVVIFGFSHTFLHNKNYLPFKNKRNRISRMFLLLAAVKWQQILCLKGSNNQKQQLLSRWKLVKCNEKNWFLVFLGFSVSFKQITGIMVTQLVVYYCTNFLCHPFIINHKNESQQVNYLFSVWFVHAN